LRRNGGRSNEDKLGPAAPRVRVAARGSVHLPATFIDPAHLACKVNKIDRVVMKNIVPLVLALIPLAAVVGACITCP